MTPAAHRPFAFLGTAVCVTGCGQAQHPAAHPDHVSPRPAASVVITAPPAAPPTEPASAPCLPATARDKGLAGMRAIGDKVEVCYAIDEADGPAGSKVACITVNVERREAVSAAVRLPWQREPVEAPSRFTVHSTRDELKVCPKAGGADCAVVTPGYKASRIGDADTHIAAVSPDGARLLVIAPQLRGDSVSRVFLDVFDIGGSKHPARATLVQRSSPGEPWTDPSNTWSVSWPGRRALLRDYSCCGPGGAEYLLDPATGVTRFLHSYQGALVPVPDRAETFLNLNGKRVSIANVDSGILSASLELPGAPIDDPETVVADVAFRGATAYVAYANPPGIVRLEVVSQTWSQPFPLPLCPDASAVD